MRVERMGWGKLCGDVVRSVSIEDWRTVLSTEYLVLLLKYGRLFLHKLVYRSALDSNSKKVMEYFSATYKYRSIPPYSSVVANGIRNYTTVAKEL